MIEAEIEMSSSGRTVMKRRGNMLPCWGENAEVE